MKTKAMNDDTMLDLIDTVYDVIDDLTIDGYDSSCSSKCFTGSYN